MNPERREISYLHHILIKVVRRDIAAAVAAEREACATVASDAGAWCRSFGADETADRIAAAIRARGDK